MRKDETNTPELKNFSVAINMIPGLVFHQASYGTFEEDPRVWIFFGVEDMNVLPELLYWINPCHSGKSKWVCEVRTDCAMSNVSFCIESGISGPEALVEANFIADLIKADQEECRDDKISRKEVIDAIFAI